MSEETEVVEAEHAQREVVKHYTPREGVGKVGAHLCRRCGWRWDHREGRPNPPKACPFCHSYNWDRDPIRLTAAGGRAAAGSPDDPKWAKRRDRSQYKKALYRKQLLEKLAEEFNVKVVEQDPPPQPMVPPPPRARIE